MVLVGEYDLAYSHPDAELLDLPGPEAAHLHARADCRYFRRCQPFFGDKCGENDSEKIIRRT